MYTLDLCCSFYARLNTDIVSAQAAVEELQIYQEEEERTLRKAQNNILIIFRRKQAGIQSTIVNIQKVFEFIIKG